MSFLKKHLENSAYVPYFAYNVYMDPQKFYELGIFCKDPMPCVLLGHRLTFNVLEDIYFRFEKRGQANIVPSVTDCVEGVIYQVHSESLNILDHQAGVYDLKYYRKLVDVKDRNGNPQKALTYAAWPDVTSEGLLPSKVYLHKLICAADHYNFSDHFKQWLLQHPTTS